MHRISVSSNKSDMLAPTPFGGGFSEEEVKGALFMEVWATDFKDGDVDFCECRLLNAQGLVTARKKIAGY